MVQSVQKSTAIYCQLCTRIAGHICIVELCSGHTAGWPFSYHRKKLHKNWNRRQYQESSKQSTFACPSTSMTLKGCHSGCLISSSHFENRSVNSSSSWAVLPLQAAKKAFLSGSPILLTPIRDRAANILGNSCMASKLFSGREKHTSQKKLSKQQ